jgi:hypothetical protein
MGREIESHLGIVCKFLFLIMFWSLGKKRPKMAKIRPIWSPWKQANRRGTKQVLHKFTKVVHVYVL